LAKISLRRGMTWAYYISPLLNTDRKGEASRIMIQQFWRAIGCETVRGQAYYIM
jgi:hypothetical protein